MASRIGPKGQVVIPKDLRDRVGLRPGGSVGFRLRANDGVIELYRTWDDPIIGGPRLIQQLTRTAADRRSASDDLRAMRTEDDGLWEEQLARLSRKRSS